MEFMTGVKKKEDISVKTLLEIPEGTEVKLEGAVHIIRDMGEVAFVILRKSEGPSQKMIIGTEDAISHLMKFLYRTAQNATAATFRRSSAWTTRSLYATRFIRFM